MQKRIVLSLVAALFLMVGFVSVPLRHSWQKARDGERREIPV